MKCDRYVMDSKIFSSLYNNVLYSIVAKSLEKNISVGLADPRLPWSSLWHHGLQDKNKSRISEKTGAVQFCASLDPPQNNWSLIHILKEELEK